MAVLTARARPIVTIQASVTSIPMLARIIGREFGSRQRIWDEYWEFTTDGVGDRTPQDFRSPNDVPFDMEILSAHVTNLGGVIKRGQLFVSLQTQSRGPILANGYVHAGHPVSMETFESSVSGMGHLSWRVVVSDVTPVDVIELLAVSDARRRIYGFAWYYHCGADVANRLLRASVRAPGTGIPTGFSIAETVQLPHSADLSLQQNEEGILYSYNGGGSGGGIATRNDNGALTAENPTTQPQPWPMDVAEDDLVEIQFNLTDEEAADRHSIFILQEEWIEL